MMALAGGPQESPPPWGTAEAPVVFSPAAPAAAPPPRAPPQPELEPYLRTIAEGFYWGYRWTLSSAKGENCAFAPSCSAYGRAAIQRFGLPVGLLLFGARLMKGHIDFMGLYRVDHDHYLDPLEDNLLWMPGPSLVWHRALGLVPSQP